MTASAPAAGPKAPLLLARSAGLFYVATTLFGIFAELVRKRLIVSGDATATAHNILGSEAFYRGATAADILSSVCYVAVTVLLYQLLKPMNKTVSAVAAALSLVGIAITVIATVSEFAALPFEKGASYLAVFSKPQLEALAYAFIRLRGQGYDVALIFVGFYYISIGYLLIKSRFMPVVIGVLMVLGGICYLIDCFSLLLIPLFATLLSSFILYPAFVSKATLILWLAIAGINVKKWNERNKAYRLAE